MQQQIFFDDIEIGQEVSRLRVGPLTSAHLMRWSAAIENWHKIHYDREFAIRHDKLPDLLVNGSLKQQFIVRMLKDWAGPLGWVWKVNIQFRAMNVVGETLECWGVIRNAKRSSDFGIIEIDIGICDEAGRESTPGNAHVVLPFRSGPPLPYPFRAPAERGLA